MKNRLLKLLIGLIFLSGLCVFSYPLVSNLYTTMNQTQAVNQYEEKLAADKQTRKRKQRAAQLYNATIGRTKRAIEDPFKSKAPKKKTKQPVKSKSDPPSTVSALAKQLGKTVGTVRIPKIDVSLPIYNGTNDAQLEKGAGLMPGTSVPFTGKGVHGVITAHRGLPKAKLFTDLPKLQAGDRFYINTTGKTLVYQVDQKRVVNPTQIGAVAIDPQENYVTLLTCTPYMINSHRLLVRGRLINVANHAPEQRPPWLIPLLIVFAISVALALISWLVWRKRRRDRRSSS